MAKTNRAANRSRHREPTERTETLYEAELRRRHPGISSNVLEAWSEGR